MDHVITIGNVVEGSAAVIAVVVVIGALLWLLSVYGSGFDHWLTPPRDGVAHVATGEL